MASRNAPPARNPTTAGTQEMPPCSSDISMAGANNDQKLAAIITPAAKPSIEFKTFCSIFLKKKTIDAPKAVTPHVNKAAINASNTGLVSKIVS